MHPHILITAEPVPGLRSLGDVRRLIQTGRAADLWRTLIAKAARESSEPPWTPRSALPSRQHKHVRNSSREFELVGSACSRILDAALAALVLGERRYAEAVLRQLDAIFNETLWPEIDDAAHLRSGDHCSLRRGQFALAIGLAYDWLHELLTDTERTRLIEGFDQRFTRPFRAGLDAPDRWVKTNNNFITVIYGGFGIAGMGFGPDYTQSPWLVEVCTARMEEYIGNLFGPEGEFNESVQYAGSTHGIVHYLMAMRYASGGRDNPLQRHSLKNFCHWYMHMTFPPGRVAGFGDNRADAPPATVHFAAIAAALRDPVLQWFYLQYADTMLPTLRKRALEILYYDADLPAEPPTGRMPLGRAYHAEAQLISSRSSWDPDCCASVVYAKAGREDNHGHPDWGQVCIDGYGERLIIDLGSTLGYPRGNKDPFYNYQQLGHNVPVFGDNATGGIPCSRRGATGSAKFPQGRIVSSSFNDATGGAWTMDLTEPYNQEGEVIYVRRSVIHLLPDIAVVCDDILLSKPDLIRLRWHTITPATPDKEGSFSVQGRMALLAARVLRLDGPADYSLGRHEYRAPYNVDRIGAVYQQRHEPYVQLRTSGTSCRLLTLFAVFNANDTPSSWSRHKKNEEWHIATVGGDAHVAIRDNELMVGRNGKAIWHASL